MTRAESASQPHLPRTECRPGDFFAFERAAPARAPVAAVVEMLGSEWIRAHVDALPGYEATDTGRVIALGEAFGAAD